MPRGYLRFWTEDLEPLSGRLRLVFYLGILILALTGDYDSPLRTGEIIATTDATFYTPMGVMNWIGTGWATPGVLSGLQLVTMIALVFAGIGFLHRFSAITAAIGFFLLHGVIAGAVGVTHRWYIVTYSLLALMLAATPDRFSVDHLLRKKFAWYPRANPPALLRTGFARKIVLFVAVAILFTGGVSKLVSSGLAWCDGTSLQFYIQSYPNPRWPWLSSFLVENLWAARLLSIGTIVFELGAVVALFSRRLRHLVILGACGLHVGILLVMLPTFLPHMWCYLLLIDWGRIGAWWKRREAPGTVEVDAAAPSLRVGAAIGTAFAALLVIATFARIEYWPLTHVPMYASYRGPTGEFSPNYLRDWNQVRGVAQECHEDGFCSWMPNWVGLYLVHREKGPVRFTSVVRYGEPDAVWPPQLYRTIWHVLSEDIAIEASEVPPVDPGAPDDPANSYLSGLASYVRERLDDWNDYHGLVIICRLEDGPVVVAAADL